MFCALLGRDAERDELVALTRGLALGTGFATVVQGEAGIGKSALLDAVARDATATGVRVLRTGGVEGGAEIPFRALADLLAPVLDRCEALPRRQADRLEAALALADGPASADVEVFVAAADLLRAAGREHPLLCLVDDAHWLDAASADAVLFAARRLLAEPVGLVLATREDVGSRLDSTSLSRLPLLPLPERLAADLVRATAAGLDSRAIADVVRAAEGNPLALVEFASHAHTGGAAGGAGDAAVDVPLPAGERVERIFRSRTALLPAACRTALLVLAAAEQADAAVVLPAVVALTGETAALDPAVDAGLIGSRPGGYAFRHPLARSAAYHSAGEEDRRRAHAALADALDATRPELAAWHRARAARAPDETVAAALEATAAAARRRGGRVAEARALELAARLSPAPAAARRRLLGAGAAALQAGRPDLARPWLVEVAEGADDVRLEADARLNLAQIDFWAGGRDTPDLAAVAERVEPVDRDRAARLLSLALVPAISDCRIGPAVPIAEQAWALIDRGVVPLDVACRVAHVLVMAAHPAARDLTVAAAAATQERGDLGAAVSISQPLWWLERYDDARGLLAGAVAQARASDALWQLGHGLVNQAELDRRTGRLAAARGAAEEAIALTTQLGDPFELAEALAQLAAVEAETGDFVQSRAHAQHAERLVAGRSAPSTELLVTTGQAFARTALAAGHPEQAAEHLQPLLGAVIAGGVRDAAVVPAVLDAVEACVASGRRDEAKHYAAWLAQAAAGTADARRHWTPLAAAVAAALVDPGCGTTAVRNALERDDGASPVLTARAWLVYGEAVRRRGSRSEARRALATAERWFRQTGALAWLPRAAAELRASGGPAGLPAAGDDTARVPPADPGHTGAAAALTPQERRVAALAAQGARNREIAERLCVSEKTVETHLAAAFRKLAVRSRTELAARLGRT